MKTRFATVLAVCFAFLLASSVMAEDKAKKKEKKGKKDPTAAVFAFPKQIKLSAEQQQQVEALKKEYASKVQAAQKKLASIVTPERKKAAADAVKQAKADGKTDKKELKELYNTALKVTEEEKQSLKAAGKEFGTLRKEIQKKKLSILTAEQKESLKRKPKAKDAAKPKKTKEPK